MELQVIEQNVIVAAFQTQGGTDALFDHIADQARSFVPDVTTKKGRDAIGSLAAKVSSSKKIAEKYAIDLVADQKAQIKVVDQDRIQFCKKMDALRDEILAPRDAYQKAEDDRVAKHELFIITIRDYVDVCSDYTADMYQGAINRIELVVIDSSLEEFEQEAKLAKFETLEKLRTALAAREKHEAEQAELEKLRVAEQARIQQERDAQIALEATQKAQREAEEKAKAEAERVANEQRQAAEKAERDRVAAAQREAALQVEKEAAILREQQAKAHAEQQAKQAEIDKQQAIEAERKRIEQQQVAEAERVRKEAELREADVAHKKQICGEALKGLTDLGVEAELGRMILNAINKGKVPHVSIEF